MADDEQKKDDLDLGAGADGGGPADDPLADVQAEPIEDVSGGPDAERLGGTGAEIGEELPPEDEVLREPEEGEGELEPEEPEPEPRAEEMSAEDQAAAARKAGDGDRAEPKPEKQKPKAPKTQPREYKVLRVNPDETLDSPLKSPVKARNGDDAIKEAYKALASSGEETMTLVAIPTGYYRPKEVKGREKKDYAVEVN